MIRPINIKILDKRATLPAIGTPFSAGYDLSAMLDNTLQIPPLESRMIHTGIAIDMMSVPEHLMAMVVPRSGKGAKEGKVLGNLTGIIDKDYQGEIMVSLWNRNRDTYIKVEPFEKIAQLIFVPIIHCAFTIVDEFPAQTIRGEGGFGSTGV